MRRLALAYAFACLILAPSACKRRPKDRAPSIPTFVAAASTVQMNDPANAEQLLSGFYQIEDHSWRWTAPKFTVVLRPQAAPAPAGLRLSFKFNLPDGLLKQGPVTLTATAGPQTLAPETYTTAGNQNYARDLPPSALSGDVIVTFTCDRTLPRVSGDIRQLALIAVSVGLETK